MLAKQNKGYTLLEVMMALAIAGILLAVGVPGLTSFVKNNRMLAETNGLMTVLKTARSEAMTQRTNVTVCKSNNGTSCSGNWNEGYIAFLDTNGNGTVDSETVIMSKAVKADNIIFTYSDGIFIRFDSRGMALGSSGTMTFCDDRGSVYSRGIVIEPIGRSSSLVVGGGSC